MIVEIRVEGRRRVTSWLQGWGARINEFVGVAVEQQTLELHSYIVGTLLNGLVLKARTGALASHVFYEIHKSRGDYESYGKVYISKEMVPYAAAHEYGVDIAHPGGTAFFISKTIGGEYMAGGPTFVANKNPISVYLPRTAAHTVPIPQRSYMRRGLADRHGAIVGALKFAVQDALRTGVARR